MLMSVRARFYVGLLLMSVICLAAIKVIPMFVVSELGSFGMPILAYNLFLVILSYEMIAFGAKGDHFMFHNFYMAATTIRMLLSMAVFVLYLLLFESTKVERLHFTITFFLMYFSFTAFEIINLFSKLRQN